jgi:hypothetical protein
MATVTLVTFMYASITQRDDGTTAIPRDVNTRSVRLADGQRGATIGLSIHGHAQF